MLKKLSSIIVVVVVVVVVVVEECYNIETVNNPFTTQYTSFYIV
jgi:hypothetical protein